MSGRKDFNQRKQRRIESYKVKAEKNKMKAKQRAEKGTDILRIMNGQPLLIGHHSESRHRADLKRIDNNFRKANELENKSNYYADKAESAIRNTAVSSDDPEAIQKLEQQLHALEKTREDVKKKEHTTYELQYISAKMKRIKDRIEELKELEKLDFKDIEFTGGKVIHNIGLNRIQILFESKPNEEIRRLLKRYGFRWARTEGAWQRLFNKRGICVTKYLVKEIQDIVS